MWNYSGGDRKYAGKWVQQMRTVALFSPTLWLLVFTTVFTEGGLGVNGNLLN